MRITSIESENTTTETKMSTLEHDICELKYKCKTKKSTLVSEILKKYTNQIKEVYPNTKTATLDNKVHSQHWH